MDSVNNYVVIPGPNAALSFLSQPRTPAPVPQVLRLPSDEETSDEETNNKILELPRLELELGRAMEVLEHPDDNSSQPVNSAPNAPTEPPEPAHTRARKAPRGRPAARPRQPRKPRKETNREKWIRQNPGKPVPKRVRWRYLRENWSDAPQEQAADPATRHVPVGSEIADNTAATLTNAIEGGGVQNQASPASYPLSGGAMGMPAPDCSVAQDYGGYEQSWLTDPGQPAPYPIVLDPAGFVDPIPHADLMALNCMEPFMGEPSTNVQPDPLAPFFAGVQPDPVVQFFPSVQPNPVVQPDQGVQLHPLNQLFAGSQLDRLNRPFVGSLLNAFAQPAPIGQLYPLSQPNHNYGWMNTAC